MYSIFRKLPAYCICKHVIINPLTFKRKNVARVNGLTMMCSIEVAKGPVPETDQVSDFRIRFRNIVFIVLCWRWFSTSRLYI
jgi:hypothetical protein